MIYTYYIFQQKIRWQSSLQCCGQPAFEQISLLGSLESYQPRFQKRFTGNSGIEGSLSYNHPTSKFTSLYIVTSQSGDHNGAFDGLEAGTDQPGFWNMCARMLRMSSLYNVVYKRVDNLADATDFVKQVGLAQTCSPLNFTTW